MATLKKYFWPLASVIFLASLILLFRGQKVHAPRTFSEVNPVFVGPRQDVPESAPTEHGFLKLAITVPDVLSRSGQPDVNEFKWLKDNGWKSVVDLRTDGEYGEVSDDEQIPGFNDLGFNYLKIQIVDGYAPTDKQAQDFLDFVNKPENQPALVHCRAGVGRTGTMVALYRYSIQGWPLESAIDESRLFDRGINNTQIKWLKKWAKSHAPGSYGK